MGKTKIEWTDYSWPVINGCRRISPGCGGASGVGGCYAERLSATRLSKTPKYTGLAVFGPNGPRWTGKSRLWVKSLAEPLRIREPKKIFVADMGDLFFEENSNEDIAAVYGIMAAAPRHTFQVLTKRSKRAREWYAWVERHGGARRLALLLHHAQRLCEHKALRETEPVLERPWPLRNVWLGASVEDQQRADERVPELLRTPAAVRFVSYEPALGPVDFRLKAFLLDVPIDWLIVGGESGPGARRFEVNWAEDVIRQCKYAGVDCFVKQLGSNPHVMPPLCRGWVPMHLKDRKGGDPSEWPEHLRVREFPEAPCSA